MPSGKELIRLNSVAHLLNQLAAGTLAGQPNAAGTQAAQNVAVAEEGIQGGLAQGKQKAMQEEMEKKKKKGLLKQVVSSIVGTAASAIPVVGPVVGPMIGEAAGSAVSGQKIDPASVAAAGVGGIGGAVQQSLDKKAAAGTQEGPIVSTEQVNSGAAQYDPTTGQMVATPAPAPAAATAPTSQEPVPASTPLSPPTTQPSTPAPAPSSVPAPTQASGEAQAVQAAQEAIAPPTLASMPPPPAAPALPTPQTAPENPNNPPPLGLGQRIARALVSPTGGAVTSSIQQFLASRRETGAPPTVYAPGLNPQTSMAIDQEFARQAEADAQRQLQEEQLGLQREGMQLDRNRFQLDKEKLAQDKAANDAMRVLEQGKLALGTYQAGAQVVNAENQNKLNLYGTQVQQSTAKEQMATQERIAQAGDATQLKAAGISAGASLEAARLNVKAQQEAAVENRRFQASMANMQNQQVSISPEGEMVVTGPKVDPSSLAVNFEAVRVPLPPTVQDTLKSIQQQARSDEQAKAVVTMAYNASKDSMGIVDPTKVPENLAVAMRAFNIAAGPTTGPAPAPGAKPAPGVNAAARTEANDAKLKALKAGQVEQPATDSGPKATDPKEFINNFGAAAANTQLKGLEGQISQLVQKSLDPVTSPEEAARAKAQAEALRKQAAELQAALQAVPAALGPSTVTKIVP